MQLTLSQAARMFGVSENVITRWVRQANLPAHEINSQYRFNRGELLEWAATNRLAIDPMIFKAQNGVDTGEASLSNAIELGGVASNVAGGDRYEVFRNAIQGLPQFQGLSSDSLLDLLIAREKSGGTGIGHGIAVPHPRYPVLVPGCRAVVRVCYLSQPLDFAARDQIPVDTLFLMICPTVHEHLELLARLVNVLQIPEFVHLLARRPDQARLLSAVRAAEASYSADSEVSPT